MAFFSKNLYYIKFFSDMYYHVFSTKADQEGGSIHEKKNLFLEIHILEHCTWMGSEMASSAYVQKSICGEIVGGWVQKSPKI